MAENPAAAPDPHDVRPVIASGSAGNTGLWVFLAIVGIGGIALFSALSANREASSAPETRATLSGGRIASPPPLALPRDYAYLPPERYPPPYIVRASEAERPARVAPVQSAAPPRPAYAPLPPPTDDLGRPVEPQPSVVYEPQFVPPPPAAQGGERGSVAGRGAERVTAGRFANPSHTVPLGTVIPAVLETALDSTRPGAVRALVQRDIRGFDGSRVLIPRGSRLYGEYEGALAAGQKRAAIRWTRLMRPDGVTIDLDSPASDPLGRAGLTGDIDSKFLQRFGGAILQSILDVGVGVATRKATDGVIVALPGSTQNLRVTDEQAIQPTLRVRHGTSVSVFVARDLDFSTVDS